MTSLVLAMTLAVLGVWCINRLPPFTVFVCILFVFWFVFFMLLSQWMIG